MNKNPDTISQLPKIIKITQKIEGYAEAPKQIVQKAKAFREKYGIKVSGLTQ